MATTPAGEFKVIKHSKFFLDMRMIQNVLFRVDVASLQNYSETFKDIFSIPPSGPLNEGSEENPVILQGISVDEFEAFLTWLYHIAWRSFPHTEETLVSILSVSHMWQVQAGFDYAMDRIVELNLPAARMLHLGARFRIRDWVLNAVPILLATSARQLTDHDIELMGARVISIIIKAKEVVDEQRKTLAAFPPPLSDAPSWGCETHASCHRVWRDTWWKVIAKAILHPKFPRPLTDCIGLIVETPYIGMSAQCKQEAILSITEQGNFSVEEEIRRRALDSILSYHGL
ncbi:hypothetical protein EYR40_007468 [Pleurotus pulmonarius]|nr:hypothetical protein EYR38_008234 [Pleurotus pulmonarius]KAF4597018.1 hypothetical protein EYR40_007468 [Pleurotus pulmonarius]